MDPSILAGAPRGDGKIKVLLMGGRLIEAKSVAPNALGTIRVDLVEGKTEFHDATKIVWIRNDLGWDVTTLVLDEGKTVRAP